MSTRTLLQWAQAHDRDCRAALAISISDLFADEAEHLSDRERALMEDILRKIVGDLETAVRRAMSERLADLPEAPPDLIRFFANDEASVAFPVLTRSGVLRDDELIEVVRHRTLEHQLAVAMRFHVSERVSSALVETGNVDVIDALLQNENARISQVTLAFLVDQSQRVDSFREPLLNRRELGPDLAKRMFLWVSAALRNHIIERFNLDEETIDALLQEAALKSIEDTMAEIAPGGAEQLAEALAREGMVDEDSLVEALAKGEVGLFLALFGRATGLRERLVRRMLFTSTGHDLAIACKATGISRRTLETLFSLSRSARPQLAADAQQATRQALAAYDQVAGIEARRILHRWRLDPDYAAAIDDLEAAADADG